MPRPRSLRSSNKPGEFILIGFDSHIRFEPVRGSNSSNAQFLWVEEGRFEDGQWKAARRLNGDETFFGVSLPPEGTMLRVKLMSY